MGKLGDVVEATITNIQEYGAFADFGEGSGLIHFSKVVPKVKFGEVGTVLSIGKTVKCEICEIRPDGKVSLSMKFRKSTIHKQKLEEAGQANESMSSVNTSIKSVWKVITDIQHFMLKYMSLPISIKKGSCRFSGNGERLLAQIDTTLHFDLFKQEVRRIYACEIVKHERLSDFWVFNTDVDLHSLNSRSEFVDKSKLMYVSLRLNPYLEVQLKDILNGTDKEMIKKRLSNYYPQCEYIEKMEDPCTFTVLLPYGRHYELNELKEEIGFAIDSIRNGLSDIPIEGEPISYPPINFSVDVFDVLDGKDTFYASMDAASLLDNEGLRFGSLRGQSFLINGESFGHMSKIDYPNVEFKLAKDCSPKVKQLILSGEAFSISPDTDDLTGEFEKINRLRDSFDRITEHPENLVNPMLSAYLFDASKAKGITDEKIDERISRIRKTQLNEHLNNSQVKAIAKAVEAPDLALIQGPPGTGKSTAIAELIWQLTQENPKQRILITSEANLAVDNALDKLKSSTHNIVRPIRLAAGDKYSAEGLSYAMAELKKWAGVPLSDLETQDYEAAQETDEYKNFKSDNVEISRWLKNIYNRSQDRLKDEDLRRLWHNILCNCPSEWRLYVLKQYLLNVNVIGATCSAITDTNYSASDKFQRHADSRFIKKYREVFDSVNEEKKKKKSQLRFDVVIQDEASKATPAELSLPLTYGYKAIVIGDHRQLPPNLDKEDILFKLQMQRLRAEDRAEYKRIVELEDYVKRNFDILEKSHFERLFLQIDQSLKGTFDTQYRMHKDINDVIEQFYIKDNGLHCGVPDESRQHGITIPNFIEPLNHVIWIDTKSPEIREGTSRANRGETEAIQWILNQFAKSNSFKSYLSQFESEEDREIGIITFYGGQLKRLQPIVKNTERKGLSIKMSSVDRFQGMERNIIIVSLVRSNCIADDWNSIPDYGAFPEIGYRSQKDIGFAKSPNRLNVALSRAKRLLIIVGNAKHFQQYVNAAGEAIYNNVVDIIKSNPNGKIIDWSTLVPQAEKSKRITKVPMPKKRSVNLNTRDINIATDKNLRIIETWFTHDKEPISNPHFAVLELSTKAVKLLRSRIDETDLRNAEFTINNFERKAQKTETGKGLDDQNNMDMDYFRGRVLPVIQNMKRDMRMNDIDVVYTVATAAYRTAKNRDEIIECIRKEAGINVRILSKKEESVATMFAYGISSRYKVEIQQCPHSIMIDQGGGSTEVSVFNQGELVGSYSINLGTTALRNILTKDIPPETSMKDALKKSDQMLRERMVAFIKNMGGIMNSSTNTFCVSVGTAITSATGKKNNAAQHDSILSYESLSEKIQTLTAKILDRFETVNDLIKWESQMADDQMDRNLTMRMGLPMFILLMDKFNIPAIHVCGTGLWYGIYLQNLYNIAD